MLRSEKVTAVAALREKFSRSVSVVFLDYKGLTVAEVGKVRDAARAKGVEYKVVKNTLVKQALAGQPGTAELAKRIKGMTGVLWSYEDPSASAKVSKDLVKENEKLRIKAGLLEGQVLDATAVSEQLANMPGKNELRAQFLGLLNAPAQQMLGIMQAPAKELVGILEAKRAKDDEGSKE